MNISEALKSIKNKISGIKASIIAAYTAIENKGGILPAIQDSANLVSAIESIPAVSKALYISRGGELGTQTIFIDFDGTPLYAYTKEEILALEELPKPYTTHERLTFVKWNYTLEEIKERVELYDWIDVGAMYVPTDGWGEMQLSIGGKFPQLTPHFRMWLETEGTLTMDWGDGTIEDYNGVDLDVRHTYANAGDYLVRFISTTTYYGLYTYNDTKALVIGRFVFPTNSLYVGLKVGNATGHSGGNNPEENNKSWGNPQCLAFTLVDTIVLPPGCNYGCGNSGTGISHMYRLKSLVSDTSLLWRGSDVTFPSCRFFSLRERIGQYAGLFDSKNLFVKARSHFWGTIQHGGYCISGGQILQNLERIAGSVVLVNISDTTGHQMPQLRNTNINLNTNSDWTTGGIGDMYNCFEYPSPAVEDKTWHFYYMQNNICIKDYKRVITTGSGNYFGNYSNNVSLQTITLNVLTITVQQIRANTFSNCFSLKEIILKYQDLSVENPPVVNLTNINAFTNCPQDMKIYVPARLVDAYKTATNWSTYADQIYADPNQE